MESGHGMSGDQCLSRRLISKIPFVMLFRNSQADPVAEYTLNMHQCGETTPHPRVLLEPSQTPCGKRDSPGFCFLVLVRSQLGLTGLMNHSVMTAQGHWRCLPGGGRVSHQHIATLFPRVCWIDSVSQLRGCSVSRSHPPDVHGHTQTFTSCISF